MGTEVETHAGGFPGPGKPAGTVGTIQAGSQVPGSRPVQWENPLVWGSHCTERSPGTREPGSRETGRLQWEPPYKRVHSYQGGDLTM